jgi:3-mercaptopyruvate sulfurtransferase SseA
MQTGHGLVPDDELRAMFAAIGVTPDREFITRCQTHQRTQL